MRTVPVAETTRVLGASVLNGVYSEHKYTFRNYQSRISTVRESNRFVMGTGKRIDLGTEKEQR